MDILEQFLQSSDPPKPGYTAGLHRHVKRLDGPPEYHQPAWQSLSEFRQTMTDTLRVYMQIPDPDFMLLIPAPPGSGKTWAGVDFAHWVYDNTAHRVLYAGPRRAFYDEIILTSVRQENDLRQWYDWKPRREHEDPELHTCNHTAKINQWLGMGYDGMDFCSTVCGWDYVNKGCPYHAQKSRTEPLIYGHHLHVTLGHPMAKDFAVVIGDELPISAVTHEWTIPGDRVQLKDTPYESPLAPLLHELNKICEMKPEFLVGPALLDALGGPVAIVEAVDDELLALFADAIIMAPPLNSSGDLAHVPANFLPTFLPILRREADAALSGLDYPHRLMIDKRGLTILTRRAVNPQMPKHMIWFDATGSADLYEAMFQRPVHVLDAQPKPAGRIFQVTDRGNGKGSLIQRTEDGPEETSKAIQLRAQIDYICKDYKNPGIISHMALEDGIAQETRHFYGSRGTNDFEECDVLIVAGTPMIPAHQIEKAARCLWPERMRPFDKEFITIERSYQFSGNEGEGYSYPVAQFVDSDLNILLEQYREFEIVQAAHRSRMLFRETDVWLLTNIPIDQLPPHKLLTLRELFDAPLGVDVFRWQAVVEFIENQDIVTVPDLVEAVGINREAAKKYMAIFVSDYGWEWVEGIRRPGARGPAPKSIHNVNNSRITY